MTECGSTPCLNKWKHVEIGLRRNVVQSSLVSLLDVQGCSLRCCSVSTVGLYRLRWITLRTNWQQEEQPALKAMICNGWKMLEESYIRTVPD